MTPDELKSHLSTRTITRAPFDDDVYGRLGYHIQDGGDHIIHLFTDDELRYPDRCSALLDDLMDVFKARTTV